MFEHRYWHGLKRSVNPLGFGCWQLAGEYNVNGKPHGWGKLDRKQAIDLIHFALENGIQFFDTAQGYGHGSSEEILGEGVKTSIHKNSAVLCTKIPLKDLEEKNLALDDDFRRRVECSLRRLEQDQIDILLLHNPSDHLNWSEFDKTILESLVGEGKIVTYGVSCRSINGAKSVINSNFGSCIEWVFNLFERRPVEEIFPALESRKMNFIARSPLSRGLISSKNINNSNVVFGDNEFRSTLPKDWIDWTINSLTQVKKLDESPGGVVNFAFQFCLSHKDVSVIIPGIRKKEHIINLVHSANVEVLDDHLLAYLENKTEKNFPNWS